jgi:hypothetical protein
MPAEATSTGNPATAQKGIQHSHTGMVAGAVRAWFAPQGEAVYDAVAHCT